MNATSIDTQAADWLGRRELGLTPAEEREFQAWLTADARHGAAWAECRATWDLLDDAAAIPALAPPAPARSSLRFWRPAALAVAAAVAVGFFVLHRPDPAAASSHQAISTEAGGLKKVELADGSVIHLNGGSALTVDLTPGERRIALARGEAFFQVAPDPTRPFIVRAAGYAVRAVGTAFNVAVTAQAVDVLVTEGKVRVDDVAQGRSVLPEDGATGGPPVLAAGQRISLNLSPASALASASVAIQPVAEPEVRQALAWQIRLLDFDNQPLSDVVAGFNRHNQHQLVILDPALATQTFGGTFRADNYADLVELLESRYHVTATRRGDRTELALRR